MKIEDDKSCRQNVDYGPYSALIGRRRGLPVPLYQKRQAKRRRFDGDDDTPFEPNSPYKRRQIAPSNRRSTVKSSVRRLSQREPKSASGGNLNSSRRISELPTCHVI